MRTESSEPRVSYLGARFSALKLRTLAFALFMPIVLQAQAYCVPSPGPVCQVGQPCPPPVPVYTEDDLAAYDGLVIAVSTRPSPGPVSAGHASDYAMRVIVLRRSIAPPLLVPPDSPPLRSWEEPLYQALVEAITTGAVAGASWTWFQPASFAAAAHNTALIGMKLRKQLRTPPGC